MSEKEDKHERSEDKQGEDEAGKHCWHGQADGIVSILLPFDGDGLPIRLIPAPSPAALAVRQICCRPGCGQRRTRTWKQISPSKKHPGYLDLVETTAPAPPCSGT